MDIFQVLYILFLIAMTIVLQWFIFPLSIKHDDQRSYVLLSLPVGARWFLIEMIGAEL